MTKVTPNDAFAIALIAQRPESNKDLVKTLSANARPIGASLAGNTGSIDPDLQQTVDVVKKWARRGSGK